jgi:hypothetical protein
MNCVSKLRVSRKELLDPVMSEVLELRITMLACVWALRSNLQFARFCILVAVLTAMFCAIDVYISQNCTNLSVLLILL